MVGVGQCLSFKPQSKPIELLIKFMKRRKASVSANNLIIISRTVPKASCVEVKATHVKSPHALSERVPLFVP